MQSLVGQTLLDRYRIVRFIGRGGMAMVYEAWDERRAAAVAIKLMHEDLAEDTVFLRRFSREAETLARLDHPHIVRFLGFEQGRGLAFLVMEYVSGVPLRRQLSLLGRPLTLPETLGVLQPVCGALHYAHQLGIYHCDVKPANIFIDQGGKVILGDFGIVRLSESATVTFTTAGTPAYMSPEQCRGARRLDGRTDIYSLGITTYEMLSLDRPFKGDTASTEGSRAERVRWEHINAAPHSLRTSNPAISPQVEAVIRRALEKDPQRRYQLVTGFCSALQEAAATQAVSMSPAVDPLQETVVEQYADFSASQSVQTPTSQQAAASAATFLDEAAPADEKTLPLKRTGRPLLFGGLAAIAILAAAMAALFGRDILFAGIDSPSGGNETLRVAAIVETPSATPEANSTTAPPAATEVVVTDVPLLPTGTKPPPTDTPPPPTPSPTPSDVFVLYALNASNDMLDNGEMAIVEQGLSAHLQALNPAINAGLLAFGHKLTAFDDTACSIANVELRVPMRANNAATVWDSVTLLNPIGIAPVADALVDAHNYFTFGDDRTNALVFITDGEILCEEDVDVWRRVRGRQVDSSQNLPIYILGLKLNESEAAVYETLVGELEDGDFQNITSAVEFTEALDRLTTQLAGG